MDYHNLFNNQPEIIKVINNSFKISRLAHTYLFYGERGTLKMDAAMYFASLVLCQAGGNCGICDECKKIEKLINPNIFIISPDGESIKKEQVENLEHEFMMTSDSKRVFIIKDIDKTTLQAANSLLKFLESLPENCYGILLTENINQVIPTIKSRSICLHFLPLNPEKVVKELVSKNVSLDNAKAISKITNNVSEAVSFANDKVIIQIIELVKTIGMDIEKQANRLYLDMIEKGDFLKKVDKTYNGYFLDLLVHFQSDKLKKIMKINDNIVFSDTLDNETINLSENKEIKILELLLEYRQKLKYNVSIELMYTEMLIQIERIL